MKLHLCLDVDADERKALLSALRSAQTAASLHVLALDEIIDAIKTAKPMPDGTMMQVAMTDPTDPAGLRVTREGLGSIGEKALAQAREFGINGGLARIALVLHFSDGSPS